MFKMIEKFSFNPARDCYEKENGLEMIIISLAKGLYEARISYNEENIVNIPIYSNTYEACEDELNKLFSSKNSPLKSIEEKIASSKEELPKITKEEIKECINKSNAAEVSFLEKRVKNLESRVKVLEDSVEDLEVWRRS